MELTPQLKEIIQNRFPSELQGEQEFDDWATEIRQELLGKAFSVLEALKERLEDLSQKRFQQEAHPRDDWKLFGNEDPIKSTKSIRSKLARDFLKESKTQSPEQEAYHSTILREKILGFSDLVRCRIVCTFNLDAQQLVSDLFTGEYFLSAYKSGPIKDFVFDISRRTGSSELLGHRARQFSARIPFGNKGESFGFEVQIMTLLQHAWDRRNHPLYEWTREGNELPDALRVNDFACAETLHLVDQQADKNWQDFLREMNALKKA